MNLNQLNYEEIEQIYIKHMKIDFPPEELKPLNIIQKLIKKKNYVCYGLYENEELLAYAFIVTYKSYLLFDYYAVCKECRNRGIGSEFFSRLQERFKDYDGIIVEVEKVEDASNEVERIVRQRRIDFYKRNGMELTNISISLFNVNYHAMCFCNVELNDFDIFNGLENIYKEIIPISLYNKYVKLSI